MTNIKLNIHKAETGKEAAMGKKLAKLVDVKSIVTFVLTGVFAYLSITGTISGQDFLQVFLMVISFYFGTQSGKKEKEEEAKEGVYEESDKG